MNVSLVCWSWPVPDGISLAISLAISLQFWLFWWYVLFWLPWVVLGVTLRHLAGCGDTPAPDQTNFILHRYSCRHPGPAGCYGATAQTLRKSTEAAPVVLFYFLFLSTRKDESPCWYILLMCCCLSVCLSEYGWKYSLSEVLLFLCFISLVSDFKAWLGGRLYQR